MNERHAAPATRPPFSPAPTGRPDNRPPQPAVAPRQRAPLPGDDASVFGTLIPELRRAVAAQGYTSPTPIQTLAIPPLLAGRDLIGCAQTGTGKTAAFSLPILQHLARRGGRPASRRPRALVVAPTRELAAQIGASLAAYGRNLHVTHAVITGGVGQNPQVAALNRGLDILVATPGRLLDLMQQGHAALDAVELFVLDEADRMLDMGFLPDIRRIVARLPRERQSLFFSATMGHEVVQLAHTLVRDAVHVTVPHEAPAVERIAQRVLFVDRADKDALLVSLLGDSSWQRVLVFTQMKHVANKVTRKLDDAGIGATVIHGNKSQSARTEALARFRQGQVRVLVATDIAARGLDINDISHVINYDMPVEPETYIHRIGRTARAGAGGDAVTFCSAPERAALRNIEKLIRRDVPVDPHHPFHSENARHAQGADARTTPKRFPPSGSRQGHSPRPGEKPAARKSGREFSWNRNRGR